MAGLQGGELVAEDHMLGGEVAGGESGWGARRKAGGWAKGRAEICIKTNIKFDNL